MTKKDYALLAQAINEVRISRVVKAAHVDREDAIRTSATEASIHDVADRISQKLLMDNFNFNRRRFMAACGFEPQ